MLLVDRFFRLVGSVIMEASVDSSSTCAAAGVLVCVNGTCTRMGDDGKGCWVAKGGRDGGGRVTDRRGESMEVEVDVEVGSESFLIGWTVILSIV